MSPWQQCSSKGLLSSLFNFFRAVNTDKMEILLSKAHNNNLDIWFLNCIKLNSDICQRCLEHKKVLFLANLVMFAIHVVCKAEDCICISDSKEKVQLKDEFGQSRCQQHKSFHHMTLKLNQSFKLHFPAQTSGDVSSKRCYNLSRCSRDNQRYPTSNNRPQCKVTLWSHVGECYTKCVFTNRLYQTLVDLIYPTATQHLYKHVFIARCLFSNKNFYR